MRAWVRIHTHKAPCRAATPPLRPPQRLLHAETWRARTARRPLEQRRAPAPLACTTTPLPLPVLRRQPFHQSPRARTDGTGTCLNSTTRPPRSPVARCRPSRSNSTAEMMSAARPRAASQPSMSSAPRAAALHASRRCTCPSFWPSPASACYQP